MCVYNNNNNSDNSGWMYLRMHLDTNYQLLHGLVSSIPSPHPLPVTFSVSKIRMKNKTRGGLHIIYKDNAP